MRKISLFLLLLPALPLYAAEPTALDAFVLRVAEAAAGVKSFSRDFTQEKHLALFKQPVQFRGRLIVVRPDRLRWEFYAPVPSALILNGTEGLRCSAGAPPAPFELKSDPLMTAVAQQLWLWLGGDYTRLRRSWSMELAGENLLLLRPKGPQGGLTAVELHFNERLQPAQIVLREEGEDFTRIIFHKGSENQPVSDALFARCEAR